MVNLTLSKLSLSRVYTSSPLFATHGSTTLQNLRLSDSYFSKSPTNVIFSDFSHEITVRKTKFSKISDTAIYISSRQEGIKTTKLRYQSYFYKTDLVVDRCIFDRCLAEKGTCGGAIFANFSKVKIVSSIIDAARAKDSGGALCCIQCPSVTVSQTIFQRDLANFSSGTMHYFLIFDLSVTDTNFTEEVSALKTGAVSILSCDKTLFKFCDLFNITSKSLGLMRSDAGTTEMSNVRFIIAESTCVLYTSYQAEFFIENCLFSNAKECSIDWNSYRNATISCSNFVSTDFHAFGGRRKQNIVTGKENNTFSFRAKILYPILYGTPYLPDPPRTPSPTTPVRTLKRTKFIQTRTFFPTITFAPTQTATLAQTPMPSPIQTLEPTIMPTPEPTVRSAMQTPEHTIMPIIQEEQHTPDLIVTPNKEAQKDEKQTLNSAETPEEEPQKPNVDPFTENTISEPQTHTVEAIIENTMNEPQTPETPEITPIQTMVATPYPSATELVIFLNKKPVVAKPTEAPAATQPTFNILGENTQLVIIGGVVLLAVIGFVVFKLLKKSDRNEKNTSVFTKLDGQNVKLSRGSNYFN